MKNCCVVGCGLSSKDVILFEFPSSRLLRKRWLDVINIDKKIAQDDVVCLHHFKVGDYEDVRGKTRLKAKVVPSVFGKQASTEPTPDPLLITRREESKESTKDADNHNGNVDNNKHNSDNENVNKDNESVNKDNESVNKDNESVNKDNTESDSVCKDKDSVNKTNSDKDITKDNDGEHSNKDISANGITDNGKDNDSADKSKDEDKDKDSREDLDKHKDSNSEEENSKSDKIESTKRKRSLEDNVTENGNSEAIRKSDTVRDDLNGGKPKRVKKKWVPMRTLPRRNGRVELSEDSSSQDSVNSDLPAPPILEDLEEHLPNYQIANMKTERQIAAMTVSEDPVQDSFQDQTIEEMVITPHVPVFIELSVGQDITEGAETTNDCLMVVESVQCDVDPTLMLEARLEDEDCCEQIDIDDDDDVVDTTPVEEPAKEHKQKTPKKPKPSADPISLLTSSDEDDVIIQEPHIDTLSVSDETDEDDLPLQKLIKREKRNKKNKKKQDKSKKPENLNEVFVGIRDYFCMHCGHVSMSSGEHHNHLKTHVRERSPARTRVYQICKECGFTTASKSQLNRHMRKHLNEKKYKCPLCTYRSKYNMSLLYHLKTHEFDPNKYNCGSCGVKLESKKELLDHQKLCTEMVDKFICNTCGYIARSKRILKAHRSRLHKK